MFRESKEITTLEKRIKGERRGRNELKFGLFKHKRRKNIRTTVEIIRIKFWRCIVSYINNRECLPAILFHRLCENFWDFNFTKFVQTKFRFHIIPLANGNSITKVVGRVIGRVKRFH